MATSENESHMKSLYTQIMSFYRERILNGELPVGAQLPTEIEIARQHQISRGTVRQALNMLVSEGLLERVQGSGTFVRASSSKQDEKVELPEEKNIGLILSGSTDDELSIDILVGVEQEAKLHGYHMNVAFVEDNAQQLEQAIARLRVHCAGFIIFPINDISYDGAIQQLGEEHVPYVLIDRYLSDLESDYVGVDNSGGSYRATEHLIALGHVRIGFAYSYAAGLATTSVHDRWTGYQKALSEYGLPYDETLLLRDAPASTADVPNVYDEYITRLDRPSAIITVNDYVALGFLRAAQRNHVDVPEEFAIIGFDNVSYTAHVNPALTTMAQPRKEIGLRACNLLIARIEGQISGPARRIELSTRFIVRESCGMRLKVRKQILASQR